MPGRPRGSRNKEADQTWIDRFCTMPAADREAALRLMESNHRAILTWEKAYRESRERLSGLNAPPKDAPKPGELDLASEAEIAEAGKTEDARDRLSNMEIGSILEKR